MTPLIGAYIADTYWGRYKTICVAVFVALLGHVILIISAVPGVIDGHGAIGAFVVALIVMGFGTGLFKSNISPLVAEQYRRTKLFVITTPKGERVIVDPTLTVSRVYMVRVSFAFLKLVLIMSQSVLLPVHQHRRFDWTNHDDLL